MADITPRQHKLSSLTTWTRTPHIYPNFFQLLMLSLPSNDDLKSLLTELSTRLANRYLVIRVVQYSDDPDSSIMRYLYDIAKPFVWYRNESAGSASEEWSDDELTAGCQQVTKVTTM